MKKQEFIEKMEQITDDYFSIGLDSICLDGDYTLKQLRKITKLMEEWMKPEY